MKINDKMQFGTFLMMFSLLLSVQKSDAQTIIYSENCGTPTATTLIQNYSGWQNTNVLYSGNGTCDVRSTSASSNYGNASGGGNVMINDTVKWFVISGLNTVADTNISLYCGLRKAASNDGSDFVVEVSTDSLVWTRLYCEDSLPSGTGTSGWYRVRYAGVPSCPNLRIRFSSDLQAEFRLDDICLIVGTETVLETVEKPKFSPGGGTYYEPQQVTLSSLTPDVKFYYTLDGTTPTTASSPYSMPIHVGQSQTIKAIAVKSGMYDSEVASATYVILDTNSLVILPFDISDNSSNGHLDITQLSGFRGLSLGSSYADGSAKFESSHAGSAILTAHLDSDPGELQFDIKAKKSGSNPSSYEGVSFVVSQSPDGYQWDDLITLTETDLVVDEFVHVEDLILRPNTRYLRWKLESATKGNTQLNNIQISKSDAPIHQDTTKVLDYSMQNFAIYPNPTNENLFLYVGDMHLQSLVLLDLKGQIVKQWTSPFGHSISLSDVLQGMYVLQIRTAEGIMSRKVVKY